MNKIKLNSASLSIIPILLFIPILIQLSNNFHSGGKALFYDFILSSLWPKINIEIINTLFLRLNETIFIALISWFLSISLGIIFGIFSSDIFYKFSKLPIFLKNTFIFFLTILRSIHEIIWGLILLNLYGLDISTGIIAITIPYTAINAKVICEQLENININKIKSISQIGGNNFSSFFVIIWNPILKIIRNFGIYRFECALRSTAAIGLFGIGGIGTSIILSFQNLSFRELWTYLWSLAFIILATNRILKTLNLKDFHKKIKSYILIISPFYIIFLIFIILKFFIKSKAVLSFLIKNTLQIDNNFISNQLLQHTTETIFISLLATGIAISLPPVLLFTFNNQFMIIVYRSFSFLFRLIPPPILLLILLIFNEPSVSLGALTLGLCNAAITFKLLKENNLKSNNYLALKTTGASKRLSWFFGTFIEQSKIYLTYCSYRADIIFRETALVGVIGSIGLGWQLNESLSSFSWEEVSIIVLIYSLIAIIGEITNGKIKTILK